jgi:hypothetical protein
MTIVIPRFTFVGILPSIRFASKTSRKLVFVNQTEFEILPEMGSLLNVWSMQPQGGKRTQSPKH